MADIAKAYVQIIPSMQGAEKALQEELGGVVDDAAKKSGESGGKSLASSLAKGIAAGTAAIAGATGALVKGVVDGAKQTAQYGDNVDKMSQKIGISAEAYQKWDYVMQRAGTSVDILQAGMKTLSTQAQADSEAFQELGISQEQLASMSNEELFQTTIEKLSGMEEGSERTALATRLLGRSGTELGPLLNEGTEAIKEQMQMVDDYGMAMSQDAVSASAVFQDSLTTLQSSFTGLKNKTFSEFLPSMTAVTDGLAMVISRNGVDEGFTKITEGIMGFIDTFTDVVPQIMSLATTIIESLATSIISNIPILFSTVTQVAMQLLNYIVGQLPTLVSQLMVGITAIVNLISQQLPTIMPLIVTAIISTIQTLFENTSKLLSVGLSLLQGIVDGLILSLPVLVDALPKIINEIIYYLNESIDIVLEASITLFESVVNAIKEILPPLLEKLPDIINTIITFLVENIDFVLEGAIELFYAVIDAIPIIIDALIPQLPKIIATIITALVKAIPQILKAAGEALMAIVKAVPGVLSSLGNAMLSVGKALVQGLWNGIQNVTGWVLDKIRGFGQSILNGIKNIFGIHSPATTTEWMGEMLDKGLANGIEDNTKPIKNAISDVTKMTTGTLDSNLSVNSALSGTYAYSPAGEAGIIGEIQSLKQAILNMKIVLDSGEWVGATKEKYDNAFGVNNLIAARGLAR